AAAPAPGRRPAPPTTAGSPPASYGASETDLGRLLGIRCRGLEGLAQRNVAVQQRVPDAPREGADLGVVALHRRDEVAPRHGDAVLGALQLGLQGEEVLVGLQ